MLFHSIDFAIFLPLVFLIYWALNNHLHGQNAFILLASVVFYGWWDARFLLLIAVSSLLDYWAALGIAKSTEPRQRRA